LFKKSNWLIFLGAVIVVLSAANFWFFYEKNAPSPFDVVDAGTQSGDFLPINVPVTGAGTAPGTAPMLDAASQGTEPAAPVAGLLPDRLVIPSIFLDASIVSVHYKDIESDGVVYHQWRVPAEFAVGWQDESALLGLPGNTVLNGHHNAYGMVFQNLVKLNVGDVIIVYSGDVEFRYVVATKLLLPERGQTLATRMENARWIQPSSDERLTLVTCWPATSNTHRVIIVAFPEGGTLPTVGENSSGN
jgi:sortase A